MKENRMVLFNPVVSKPNSASFKTVPTHKKKITINPNILIINPVEDSSAILTNNEGTVIKTQEDRRKGKYLSFSLAKK